MPVPGPRNTARAADARRHDEGEFEQQQGAAGRCTEVVTADATRLRVLHHGAEEAPPLVLVHGWSCRAEFWSPQVQSLASEARIIAPDLRGHGESEAGTLPFGVDVLADDLATVLTSTLRGGERAVLAGHSMGGMAIMALAARHPEVFGQFVGAALLVSTGMSHLVDASTLLRWPRRLAPARSVVAAAFLRSRLRLPDRGVINPALRYVALGPGATRTETVFCRHVVASCAPRIRGMWGDVLLNLDLGDALGAFSIPTTVIVGERDKMIPPAQSARIAERIDPERFVVLPEIGHMCPVESPASVDAELRHLLASVHGLLEDAL